MQRLLRIPGIGAACAFAIRLEVGDIAQFASDRVVFSGGAAPREPGRSN